MHPRYLTINGLTFQKNSDREYCEVWATEKASAVMRPTLSGTEVRVRRPLQSLTLKGVGDVLPRCDLKVGDVVKVHPAHEPEPISMRFENWGYTHCPWKFTYEWWYGFTEVVQ